MESFKTTEDLNYHMPNLWLLKQFFVLLVSDNLLEQIPVIRMFHHNAKWVERGVNEDFLVRYNIWVPDTRQDPNLIYCIEALTIIQSINLHLFQRIVTVISFSNDMVNAWVGSLAY